eukprot:jgi/Botrbrau1/6201/Bobra.0344s0041.1
METEGGQNKRLIITEMVLENFKSYAGEQRVGPFHKCFSSVVGPNGSGKSNVIDAMLFVFGKRAKQLRLNKVSELIHNSTHHRNLESGRVSVYFQEIIDTGDETFDIVPNSAFIVSRTALRNNSSNYYINDKKSSFSEVTDLLKSKGIDLDNNRFLILQGEVEQISMMKPKSQTPHETGLLEYLEDIIGTDKYITLIEDASKRLEELNERRQGHVQRVKIAEKEREALEGPRATAELYMTKDAEAKSAKSSLFQFFIRQGRINLEQINVNIKALEGKLAHEKAKFQDFSKDMKETQKRFEAESVEHTRIQTELERAHEDFKSFERKDIKLREDIKHLKTKGKKLKDKLQKDAAKAEAAEKEAESMSATIPGLENQVQDFNDQLKLEEQAVERMMDDIKGEVEGHLASLQAVRAELAPWEAKIAEAQARIDVATAERDLVLKKQTDAEDQLKGAQRGQAEAQAAAKAKAAEISRMEAEAEKHRQDAAGKAREADALAKEAEKAEAALREVRGRAEQRRAEATARTSQSAVVAALLAAKSQGQISGIHGRLGDLGSIDKQYDVAASTASAALDYIVVEDTPTAQRCVELLRSRGLGVATFLILDKQKHLEHKAAEKLQPPEGVPRLLDLVRIRDNRLKVAFCYAFANTVVANDLDQASHIAYGSDKRWSRVVTLQGEMINESGTMTGGGGKPRGGRICLGNAPPKAVDTKTAQMELAQAETELKTSVQSAEAARKRASAASDARASAEKALSRLELDIPKARLEVDALNQKAADLQNRLAELESSCQMGSEDAARLTTLENEISAAEKELSKLKSLSEGLQRKAVDLQNKMDEAGGPKLKAKRAAVERLQKDISNAEETITKKKVGAASSLKQAQKLSKEVAKGEKENSKVAGELEQKEADLKALEDGAMKVLQLVEETKIILEDKAAKLQDAREAYETKQKEVNVIRTVEVEIENKIKDLKDGYREEQAKQKQFQRKVADLHKEIASTSSNGTPLEMLSEEEVAALDAQAIQYKITILEEELGQMAPDMGAIAAFQLKDAEYKSRLAELESSTAERNQVRETHDALRKKRLDEFMTGFNSISLKLKEMYQMITLGGDAELELVDSLDPFSEGIVFSVRPPKKSWKNIANLSGGEKTLSSLSLVFALHGYKPTPLYVMDEIDAALDYKNVSIVAHYIKERTKNAQFIIISLRNNMFELADRLVGIYKTENATKSVAINPGQFIVGEQTQMQTNPIVAA